jgi:prefoldin subunit 5
MKPTRDAADELAAKLPILEAELLGLRQRLARVTASQDELKREMDGLRRDRDHWQKQAEQVGPTAAGQRSWFCGRVSPRVQADPTVSRTG